MGKPPEHAESSAKIFGGRPEDYLDIHELLDSSGIPFQDTRHRALTHTSWFIKEILPRIFGHQRTNSSGDVYSVVRVAEEHILEDYGGQFIPTVQDFLSEMELQDWMDNGNGLPPSRKKAQNAVARQKTVLEHEDQETVTPPRFPPPSFTPFPSSRHSGRHQPGVMD